MQQRADRQRAQAPGGNAEALAELHGEQRDAARVLLGRSVLLGEANHQRADLRAEQRLLGGDELGCGEVAGQRV